MMENRLALQLQSLSRAQDKVLVVADLLRRRTEDGRFSKREIEDVFLQLRRTATRECQPGTERVAQRTARDPAWRQALGAYAARNRHSQRRRDRVARRIVAIRR